MKTLHMQKATRLMIGLISIAVMIGFGAAYATDICHVHTEGGEDGTQFYPAANEDFILDVKAPASGELIATVRVQGGVIAGRVVTHNGERQSLIIPREDLGVTFIFTSNCAALPTGTGYANLRTYTGKTTLSSTCIPDGNNQ